MIRLTDLLDGIFGEDQRSELTYRRAQERISPAWNRRFFDGQHVALQGLLAEVDEIRPDGSKLTREEIREQIMEALSALHAAEQSDTSSDVATVTPIRPVNDHEG
jgi:uncharacterized protein HemX